jgi:hypothetical protein
MNKITGEKIITINGQDYVLRFTWKALAEVGTKYGDTPNLFNAEIVANVAAAGLRERHQEMTAEKIMELSPPLVPFARDVQMALQWGYFGADSVPKTDADNVKKNLQKGGLLRHIKRLFNPG